MKNASPSDNQRSVDHTVQASSSSDVRILFKTKNEYKDATISFGSGGRVTLKTDRLVLCSFNQFGPAEIVDHYRPMVRNPNITKYVLDEKVWDDSKLEDFVSHEMAFWEKGFHYGPFVLFLRSDESCLGLLHLEHEATFKDDQGNRLASNCVEVGYFIDEKHWGKGLATEFVGLVVAYLDWLKSQFPELVTAEKLVAAVNPENAPSSKILERYFNHKNSNVFKKHDCSRILFFKQISESAGLEDAKEAASAECRPKK